jgi:hypothetical protein
MIDSVLKSENISLSEILFAAAHEEIGQDMKKADKRKGW